MRRVNFWYIFSLIVWGIVATIFFLVNKMNPFLSIDDTNLILGGITVGISILSLGLSTMDNPKFKGNVTCWNNITALRDVNNNENALIGKYSCITFKIDNYKKNPVNGLTINFRFPSKIFYQDRHNKFNYSFFEFKNTIMVTSDNIRFLGNTNGDSDIVFEHSLEFTRWDKNRVIYITIAGDNIVPTTFKIDNEQKDLLFNSSSKEPIKLIRVL
jgi:hypothetical protein